MIRVLKVLGMSLEAIKGILHDKRSGRMSKDDQIAFIEERRQILLRRAEQMRQLSHYLQLKIDWLKGKANANPPDLSEFLATAEHGARDLLEDGEAA